MRTIVAAALLGAAGSAILAVDPARAQVEIEYWQYTFDTRITAMERLIEGFEEANPGVTVTMNHFPYADYRTKVAAAIPAGEGPDIVQLFYGWLNDYVDAGLIQPLPADRFPAEAIEAEFYPMIEAMKIEDQYWALPTAVRSLALFYNRRLMEAAGVEAVPSTLDELVEAAKATTERDGAGNVTTVGIATGMTAQDHHWWREVLVRQFGGAPYSDDNRTVTYNDDAGRAALQWYIDLEAVHGATQSGFMDEPQAAFKGGRAAFLIDGSFRVGSLADARGLDWGVAPLPTHNGIASNYASYWVNAITSSAEGPELDAALAFIEYITTPEAMAIWLEETGELPAKPSAAELSADDEVFGPFISGLEDARTTIFVNESAQRDLMTDMVNRIELNGQPVADSLAEAAAAEQAILDEHYGATN